MRRVGCVLMLLTAVLSGAACNTSQPSQGGSSVAEVQIDAIATVDLYDCYDRYSSGVFDRIQCFVAPPPPGGGSNLGSASVPWSYSFRVIMLRAGETFPEVVAGSVNNGGTFPIFGSTTRFDTNFSAAPIRLDDPPFSFQNPRRVRAGHQDFFLGYVQDASGNVRPPIPLPTVNILGIVPPNPGVSPRYSIELKNGDSVIFEAAKELVNQGPPIIPPGIVPNITISGRLFVDGAEVTPHAGTVQSSSADGAGISFNYISK